MTREAEDQAVKQGKDKYQSRWRAAQLVGKETDTEVGRTLLKVTVEQLRVELDPWLKRARTSPGRRHSALAVFSLVPNPDLLALLLLRATLDGISKPRNFTNLALRVGTAIEQEYRLREIERKYPLLVATIKRAQFSGRSDERREKWVHAGVKSIREDAIPRLPSTLRLRAGAVALDLIKKATGLIEIVNESRGKKKLVKIVRASDELCSWLSEAHLNAELLKPLLPPLTHPPLDWTSPTCGGYVKLPLTMVKKSRAALYEEMDAPQVYTAMNAHQATPWRINAEILEVMEEAWERGLGIGGLPTSDLMPLPSKPVDIETNKEARGRYAMEASHVRSYRNTEKSRRLHVAQLLGLAKKYQGVDIWQPVTLDFRGRMYAAPSTLNSQSSDFARGLLEFAEGMPMSTDSGDGSIHFYIHGANLFGISGSLAARCDWVSENEREIAATAESPFSVKMWTEAKRPWEFLAWAKEARRYWETYSAGTFRNHLPISIDASCNGCQIWSLLLEDEGTAKATNVYPNREPADLYQVVADEVVRQVNVLAVEGSEEESALARQWLDPRLITRSVVKQAVLIIPYSGTLTGMSNAIRNALPSSMVSTIGKKGRQRSCYFLAKLVQKATEKLIPAVLTGREWLREVSNICADHQVPVEWMLPSGFRVVNDYRRPKYKTVQTWMGDKYTVSTLATPSRKLAKRRCAQTITANFTHSLDAAIAMGTIDKAHNHGVTSFSMVFDSFGTHALHLTRVKEALLSTVASVFGGRQNLLCQMREHLLTLLPEGVELPEPPIVGDFSTNQVRESRYFAS